MLRPIRWQNWLTGDVYAPSDWPLWRKYKWRALRVRLARAARYSGRKWNITSGCRSYAEQKALYMKYHGVRPVAYPGTSNHEIPNKTSSAAADVSESREGHAVGSNPKCREALRRFGLGLYVGGEPWHVEMNRPGQPWRA